MSASSKILLVEDDALLGASLEDLLEDAGYETVLAVSGEEAIELTFRQKFDLYLIDINLPLMDGLTLLKELREAEDSTAAIYLTSYSKQEKLLEGFASGADDYITKPFDNDELLARIEAILRRTQANTPKRVGEFCIDENSKEISYKQTPLQLSKREYTLLVLLLRHANKVVTKEEIARELWGSPEESSSSALRVCINRLKHQVEGLTIENIRGVGYRAVI